VLNPGIGIFHQLANVTQRNGRVVGWMRIGIMNMMLECLFHFDSRQWRRSRPHRLQTNRPENWIYLSLSRNHDDLLVGVSNQFVIMDPMGKQGFCNAVEMQIRNTLNMTRHSIGSKCDRLGPWFAMSTFLNVDLIAYAVQSMPKTGGRLRRG